MGSITARCARPVPAQELLAYLEFHGLEAHADAWQNSGVPAARWTKLGIALLEELASRPSTCYQAKRLGRGSVKGIDAVDAAKAVARDGFVFAYRQAADHQRSIVVLRQGDRPEIESVVEGLEAGRAARPNGKAKVGPVRKGRPNAASIRPIAVWWLEKGTLILTDRPRPTKSWT